MRWVQAAWRRGEGREHNGHMQKNLSMDHMQSKRHYVCVDQFHDDTNQPWDALRGNGFSQRGFVLHVLFAAFLTKSSS